MNRRGPGLRPGPGVAGAAPGDPGAARGVHPGAPGVEFETIRITLVSAAPPVEATQPAPPAPGPSRSRSPSPSPVSRSPSRRAEPEPVPDPTEPPPPQPDRADRPTPPRPTPPRRPPAEPTPGAEGLNIQTEGREFPFPEYLNNVIAGLPVLPLDGGSSPRATIYFEIMSDGSVRNIRMVRRREHPVRFRGPGRRGDGGQPGRVRTAARRATWPRRLKKNPSS
jgi:hypothetical protein